MRTYIAVFVTAAAIMAGPASSQIIGTLGNFDCVNDTGETAEGFEIEIEDVITSDITRAFPSNFSTQPYVNRFGIPDMVAYDDTLVGGRKGVRITWAAKWNGTSWVAKYGDYAPAGGGPAGHGVLFVAKPAATQGDQCWLLGQGIGYAKSGCEHFGVSYGPTAVPGKVSYHWLVPDKQSPGTLVKAAWSGSTATPNYPPIAAQPAAVFVPPVVVGKPPVVHMVAEAPENPDPADPQWGEARWVKTYTSFTKEAPNLDLLQANLVPRKPAKGVPVKITWDLLQRPPAGGVGEKEAVDDDPVDKGKGFVAVVKRYEYYGFTGVYDPETHEAICAPELPHGNGPCTRGPVNYTYVDPVSGLSSKIKERGRFLGAHNDAVNIE